MSADQPTALGRRQAWYQSQCDGEWEHGYGISISTLDNPGWRISIDLHDLKLADTAFETMTENIEHPTDWMRCWKDESKFEAACGPIRLEDVINVFLKWTTRT